MKDDEQHDDLWRLLGKAKPVKGSPFFSRNVLRAIRAEAPAREVGFVEWLRTGWNGLVAVGAAAALVIVGLTTQSSNPGGAGGSQMAAVESKESKAIDEVVNSEEFAVIANLDTLIAMDDNDVWLEGSLR